MTSPHVTLHALDRAAQRWGVSPSEAAEAAIRQVIAEGEIRVSERGLRFVLPVAEGLARVAHVSGERVVTVSTQAKGNRATRRKRERLKRRREQERGAQ